MEIDYVRACANTYAGNGWTVVTPPVGSIVDIIAQKNHRFHFVQVVPPGQAESAKFTGIAKNTFVQSAFSISAIPVHARPTIRKQACVFAFEDINTNSRIILGKKPKAVAEPPTDH